MEIRCRNFLFIMLLGFSLLFGCGFENDENSSSLTSGSTPEASPKNSIPPKPLPMDDVRYYDGDDVFLADVQLSDSKIIFSFINDSQDDLCTGYKLRIDEYVDGSYKAVDTEPKYEMSKDLYGISAGSKIVMSIPLRNQLKEGRFRLLLEMYYPSHNDSFYVFKEIEVTSSGNINQSGTIESAKKINRCDFCVIDKCDVCIHNFACSVDSFTFDLVNRLERIFGYVQGYRIVKKTNGYYVTVEAVKEKQVNDKINIIEAGQTIQMSLVNNYELSSGEYRFELCVIDTDDNNQYFLPFDFTVE